MKYRNLRILSILVFVVLIFLLFLVTVNAEDSNSFEAIITPGSVILGVGDTCQLTASPSYSYIWYSDNNAVATVTMSGLLTAVSTGTTEIHAYYLTAYDEVYLGSCTVRVFEKASLETDSYFFKPATNGEVFLTLSIGEFTYGLMNENNRNSQVFLLNASEDGTYCIISLIHLSYLCAVWNTTTQTYEIELVPSLSLNDNTIQNWNIYLSQGGHLIFVPDMATPTNLIMASCINNSVSKPVLVEYGSNYGNNFSCINFWQLYSSHIKINHYMDSSIQGKMTLLSSITSVKDFIEDKAFEQFGYFFDYNTTLTYSGDAPSSQCPNAVNDPCDDDNCGEDCDEHHKNINNMFSWLSNGVPRMNNEITVMWADRPYSAYCPSGAPIGRANSLSYTTHNDAMIQFFNLSYVFDVNNIAFEYQQSLVGIAIAHELAHLMGRGEAYTIEGHDIAGYRCVMERLDLDYRICKNYYEGIIDDRCSAFCDSCYDSLSTTIYSAYFNHN